MNLVKSFSVYLFSALLEKTIGFLIIPLLTLKLLPASIGKLSLVTSTYSFLLPFILLSTSGAIFVEYYKAEDKSKFSQYFSCALLINFIAFAFFSLAAFLGLDWLAVKFNCPKYWILAIPMFCFFEAVKVALLSMLQIMKKAFSYTIISLSYTVINFSFSLLFVYNYAMDYEGRLTGMFISGLLIALVSFIIFLRQKLIVFKFSRVYFKDIISYGIPILPHAVGILILDISDRFFINSFAGETELGIYSLSYLFGSVVYVLANAFSTAWVPYLYNNLKINSREADLKIVKVSYLYALALLIFCIVFLILLPVVYHYFVNFKYYPGIKYTYLIVSGYFFMSIYLIFAGIIFYEKKNYIFGYVAFFNIICNLILNYFLIKYYHAFGAALATCISMFFLMLIIMYFSNKLKPLPWRSGLLELKNMLLRKNAGT